MRLLILLVCSYPLILTGHAAPLSCSPPSLQNMCFAQELGPQSDQRPLNLPLLAFNPIHLFSGNKYLKAVDYAPHPQAPDLELIRYYDAMASSYSLFSSHWQLSYDIKLTKDGISPKIDFPNGAQLKLTAAAGQLYTQGSQTIWQSRQGVRWHFDAQGWLQAIHRPHHPPLYIQRHSHGPLQHRLVAIEQNQQQLKFHYTTTEPALVSHIETPVGTLYYDYEPQPDSELSQLKGVTFPDKRRLHYHYEAIYQAKNTGLITGKSIQLDASAPLQRVRSWVYNTQKQAIFMMTEQPSQWVHLQYPSVQHPQQTIITSPQGQTNITFNDTPPYAIKQVSGATCWACPPNLTQTENHIHLAQAKINRQLNTIEGDFLGWPQLRLNYDAQQRLTAWSSAGLKPTLLGYDAHGRAQHMQFANGDSQALHYSTNGALAHIDYYSKQQAWQTRIRRPHPQQLHLEHPNENEQLHYNTTGQLLSRQITRRFQPPHSQITHHWHYKEYFRYDDQQRLITHHLPEGGALHYHWQHQQLQSIHWESPQKPRQLVARSIRGGLEHSNGLLRLEYATASAHWLAWLQPHQLWWQQLLVKNPQGLITLQRHQDLHAADTTSAQHAFSYHSTQQLQAHYNHTHSHYFLWDADGSLRQNSTAPTAKIHRDPSGLPQQYEDTQRHYMLRYNPLRRLDVVLESNKTVQKNSHNSAGFRIYTQHYPQALQQLFFYHEKKLVAEFNAAFNAKLPIHAAHPVSKRYIYWHDLPIALIDYDQNPNGELLVIHSDHLGAAQQVSDSQQRLRWSAQYDVFGQAQHIRGDMDFHLRRSGQYYDLATGWHDNLLRVYLPEQGQYLEPDPLGPNPSSQLYGYARQQPLNHTDPWGLVLFAFDGTRYDERSGGVVHQIHESSLDPSFYQAGPGQADELTWDAMVAYSADRIVQQQWQNLLNYLQSMPQSTAPIPIDVIGFSRGAALARHFANQILQNTTNGFFNTTDSYGNQVQACIQPRFMGLLDSVAQIGILGSRNHLYNFSVAPAWQWVGHAVALHEYRALFPALLMGSGDNRQEIGLVGAHGDLGGGYAHAPNDETQPLSQISLQWLLWQAQAQGMSFKPLPTHSAPSAYLHDESALLAQDRNLENHNFAFVPDVGVGYTQDFHPTLGRLVRQQVKAFLSFDLPASEQVNNQRAKVDLAAYYRWLDQTLNWSPQ